MALPTPSFPWESWSRPLERYASAIGLVVSAYDAEPTRQLGPFAGTRLGTTLAGSALFADDGAATKFEQQLVDRAIAGDGAAAVFEEQLLVRALPLRFASRGVGAVVFGWVFSDYPTVLGTQRIARQASLPERQIWSIARLEAPFSQKRMDVVAALFSSIVDWGSQLHELVWELERIGGARDALIAQVSHDLRTPLSSLSARVELLLARGAPENDPAYVRESLGKMKASILEEARMIDDLLEAAATRTGRHALQTSPTHLTELVRTSCDALTPVAETKGVRLHLSVADDVTAPADATRLQQALWNLVSNAIKFTPPGGTVDVRLARREDACEIVISDTGPGIAPELLPRIFEPFAKTMSGNTRGYGLGLSVASDIVRAHGGALSAVSRQSPPTGTTFSIVLPLHGTPPQ